VINRGNKARFQCPGASAAVSLLTCSFDEPAVSREDGPCGSLIVTTRDHVIIRVKPVTRTLACFPAHCSVLLQFQLAPARRHSSISHSHQRPLIIHLRSLLQRPLNDSGHSVWFTRTLFFLRGPGIRIVIRNLGAPPLRFDDLNRFFRFHSAQDLARCSDRCISQQRAISCISCRCLESGRVDSVIGPHLYSMIHMLAPFKKGSIRPGRGPTF
jgi:hypothetical protein